STLEPPDLKRSDAVLVRAVFDGDTIDVAGYGHVRLLGIDAPEIGRGFDTAAPFGREARDRLAGLVLHRWGGRATQLEFGEVCNPSMVIPGGWPTSSRKPTSSGMRRSCARVSRVSRHACRCRGSPS